MNNLNRHIIDKPTISFSNSEYYKLKRVFTTTIKNPLPEAKLLQALKIHYNDLSQHMIQYDCTYKDYSEDGHYAIDKLYELPKSDLILLIFLSDEYDQIFTTIRRYTPNKWVHYKEHEGCIFQVELP